VYLALGEINAEYRGFSAAECGDAYTEALERCRLLEDEPEIFSALSGAGAFEITRANFAQCRTLAQECLALAARQTTKPPFVIGHRLLGGTLFLTGELTAARAHLQEALRWYEADEALYIGARVLHVQDHKSTALCYLALTLTMLGYLDSGLRAAERSLSHSQSLGDPHTVNFSLCYLAAIHHIQRDTRGALQRATESLALAREQGFATWIGISQMIRGESLVVDCDLEQGLREIAGGMEAHSRMEAGAYQPFGISLLVKSLVGANRLDEALVAVTRALDIAERTGERFYAAELLRLKGEILARSQRLAEAEDALHQAIDLSRRQHAKLLELRSVATLCSFLEEPRKQRVTQEALKPIFEWFEEGADAPDLRDARILLSKTSA
jgi:tetratricopeptide (TPR) repeat protein